MRFLFMYSFILLALIIQSCSDGVSSSSLDKTWIISAFYDYSTNNSKVIILDEFGSNERIIYSAPQSQEQISAIAWYNNATMVVYSYKYGDASSISLYDLDKNESKTIYSTTNHIITDISVAPDQSCMAMIETDMAYTNASLCIIHSDGTGYQKLTAFKSRQPIFANDSKTIYFIYNNNLCSVDKSGKDLSFITPEQDNDIFYFDMTPDASKLIYYRSKSGNNDEYTQLFLTDNIGSFHRSLFDLDTIDVGLGDIDYLRSPSISPSGNKICFGHRSAVLTFYDLDNSQMINYTSDDRNYIDISWSPDAEKVIYTTNDDNMLNIKKMSLDGQQEVLAIYDADNWIFRVSPIKIND